METIRFDQGTNSVVLVCPCGWRSVTSHRVIALRLATEHQRQVHAGDAHMSSSLSRRGRTLGRRLEEAAL